MTGALSTTEIKKRSLVGAKWLILMNGLGMPASFLVALMLGRTGPAVLGVYALAQILIDLIMTFEFYGGPAVLSLFMPKIASAEDRGRFLSSYLLILAAFAAAMLAIFRSFPAIFEFLLQKNFAMRDFGWFILLTLVVLASEAFLGTASGLMLIKRVAIARQTIRFMLLLLLGSLFLFRRGFLADRPLAAILGGFLAGYLLAAIISMTGVLRDPRFRPVAGWRLPPGFWPFSLTTMAATIFTFFYNNFDRITVLSIHDMKGLGMYQAVITLSALIAVVPHILGTTLVPMFSSLLASQRTEAIQKAYDLLQRTGSVLMTGSALFLISFSHELLSMFGERYSAFSHILAIFCITAVITSPYFANTPILTTYEKNAFRFGVSFFQILTQVVGTILFLPSFGILAIVWAKVVGQVLANVVNTLFVILRMKLGLRLPRTYGVGIAVTIAAAIIRLGLLQKGMLISLVVLAAFLGIFLVLSGVTARELRGLISLVVTKADRS